MDNNGVQTDGVQLLQGKAELIEMVSEDGTSNLDHGELVRLDGAELAEVLVDFPAGAGAGEEVEEGGIYGRLLAVTGRVQAARGGAGDKGARKVPPTRSRDYLAGRACCCARTGSYNALHGDRSLAGLEGGVLEGRETAVERIEGRVRGEESDRWTGMTLEALSYLQNSLPITHAALCI